MAFACTKPQDWRDKLNSMGIDYREAAFAEARMIQFNLSDPNGVRLELLFAAE